MNSPEQFVTSILESITDGLVTLDREWRYTYVNSAAERLLGRRRSDLIGKCVWEVYPACVGTECERRLRRAAAEQVTCDYESHDPAPDRWYDNRTFPMPDGGVAVYFRDSTERKRAEGLLEVQRRVLECVSTDAPLAEVLEVLARAIEGQAPAMACSVLLLDGDGVTLRHGAAPSLPADYCRAVDGLAIGPRAGSCGTAAHLGRPVVVADIAADPLWAEYRDLALPHGLRACWSTPILSPAGRVLGTFASYYREPRGPDGYDLQLVAMSTYLASLAIERKRAQEALRESESRFQAFLDNSPAVAWMKDDQSRYLYVNRTYEEHFQSPLAAIRGLTDLALRPAEVGEPLRRHDQAVLAAGRAMAFEEMVPDPDGRPRHWQVYKFPFADAAGKRHVGGMAVDITQRKEAEAQRLAYAEQQQALSRRVLAAQEEERRFLARELHDEFGQLLTGIELNLQAIRAGLGAQAPPRLQESINAAAEAIRQTRDFSLDLRPSILDDFGLGPALRWYAERLRGRAALAVELETHLPQERLPAHVETACFRIVQEALTNVVRHARARRVHIVAIREGAEVHLSVRDDGVGFDAAAPAEGLGLFGMRERARLVGGRMVVESSPGRGTLIRAEISTAPAPAPEGGEAEAQQRGGARR